MYLLTETEYWTPEALEKLTAKKLQDFQKAQAEWMMENERNHPDSGAAEILREEITWQVKQDSRCLNEDEAFEIERMRMDGAQLPEILETAKQLRSKREEM